MIQRRVKVATMSPDTGKALIGTSPYPGDYGYLGVLIPAIVSINYRTRHLIRLCSVAIPDGGLGRVLSLGQLLTLGACVPAAEGEQQGEPRQRTSPCDLPSIRVERPVLTPWWSFQDGNVSWHLMRFEGGRSQALLPNTLGVPGQDNDLFGTDSALLVNAFSPPAVYAPLNQGVPPGTGVDRYGTWHSLDYPWPGRDIDLSQQPEVRGPCVLSLFASVYQTDPEHRLHPAVGSGIEQITSYDGLVDEDKFVLSYPDTARYYRVAGAMEVEIRCRSHELEGVCMPGQRSGS